VVIGEGSYISPKIDQATVEQVIREIKPAR